MYVHLDEGFSLNHWYKTHLYVLHSSSGSYNNNHQNNNDNKERNAYSTPVILLDTDIQFSRALCAFHELWFCVPVIFWLTFLPFHTHTHARTHARTLTHARTHARTHTHTHTHLTTYDINKQITKERKIERQKRRGKKEDTSWHMKLILFYIVACVILFENLVLRSYSSWQRSIHNLITHTVSNSYSWQCYVAVSTQRRTACIDQNICNCLKTDCMPVSLKVQQTADHIQSKYNRLQNNSL